MEFLIHGFFTYFRAFKNLLLLELLVHFKKNYQINSLQILHVIISIDIVMMLKPMVLLFYFTRKFLSILIFFVLFNSFVLLSFSLGHE